MKSIPGRFVALLLLANFLSEPRCVHAQSLSTDPISAETTDPGRHSPLGIPLLYSAGGIGGPNSVPSQLQGDSPYGPRYRIPKIDDSLQPWLDVKQRLADRDRIQLGADYNTLFHSASETLIGNDEAASGIARVYADWTVFGEAEKTSGSLIARGEHRHRFSTDIAPAQLGFDAGYHGITGLLFNDAEWAVSTLYWEQFLCDGQFGFVIGLLEVDSFADVSGYANPWTAFQNFSVNVSPTIPFPDPNFGAAAGFVMNDQWLIKGGLYDTNNTLGNLDFFKNGGEILSHIDLSWSPSRAERYLKEFHVTAWHSDERESAGVPESSGVTFGANWTFEERLMPFMRAGWSEGGAALMRRSITLGCLCYQPDRADLAGIAFTWEDPSDRFLRDQNTFEAFFRLQLAKHFAVTPSLQVLIDPALHPTAEAITVFGVRSRVTF